MKKALQRENRYDIRNGGMEELKLSNMLCTISELIKS